MGNVVYLGSPMATFTSITVAEGEDRAHALEMGIRSGTWRRGPKWRCGLVICAEVVFKGKGMARRLRVSLREEKGRGPRIKPWGTPSFKGWGQEHPYVYPQSLMQ